MTQKRMSFINKSKKCVVAKFCAVRGANLWHTTLFQVTLRLKITLLDITMDFLVTIAIEAERKRMRY